MPKHTVTVECPVESSFRVDQVRGIFDLKKEKTAQETFDVELPAADEVIDGANWQIGVIVGPSGSGKTTVAREAFGRSFVEQSKWPRSGCVLDGFEKSLSIKEITAMLTAVGFSSPPSWVKPYHVLSGGERFRCDLARALLGKRSVVAFDEFTSVVDRTVAKIGSAAVAKSIRKGRIQKQFVAVTCHYDILDWLEPDWVLDMASGQLARGRLHSGKRWQRPKIEIEVAPVHCSAWVLFRKHHYLNTSLSVGAKCFAAFWRQPDGTREPVAFSAWTHAMSRSRKAGDMREHRTVVLPDFQGVGIGNRLSEFCASIFASKGASFSTTSHPAMIRYRSHSPNWHRKRLGRVALQGGSGVMAQAAKAQGKELASIGSFERITAGFQYVGPKMTAERAEEFISSTPRIFQLTAGDAQLLAMLETSPGWTTATALARKIDGVKQSQATTSLARLVGDGRAQKHRVGRKWVYASLDTETS